MEEIFQQVQAATGSGYAIAAAMAGLITVLIKLLARGLDFHDRHIVRKDFDRLRMLRESAPDGAPFANYLDEAIQIESFRIASGISTSSAKMAYLLQLASMGRWDRSQLRALSSYILFPSDSVAPTIHLSRIDSFDAVFSLLGGLYFVFAGLFFLVYMGLILAFPLGWFAGGGDMLRILYLRARPMEGLR